jgi:hypothetical protein
MAYYFNRITSSVATDAIQALPLATANPFAVVPPQALPYTLIDQNELYEAVNDAAQTSLGDVAGGLGMGGLDNLPGSLGGILQDVNGPFGGSNGDVLGGAGHVPGGTSIEDLMNGGGSGYSGDPFGTPTGNGALGGNINTGGGHGSGLTGTYTVKPGEDASARYADGSTSGHKKEGEVLILDGATNILVYKYNADGTTEFVETTIKPNGAIEQWYQRESTSGYYVIESSHTITIPTVTITSKTGGKHKSEGEGEGGGGIDGGMEAPDFDFGSGYQPINDLGLINVDINVGSSGGEGTPNSSVDDFAQAVAAYVPHDGINSAGGQGTGADGNTQDATIIVPPYDFEDNSYLHGAVIDPIPLM